MSSLIYGAPAASAAAEAAADEAEAHKDAAAASQAAAAASQAAAAGSNRIVSFGGSDINFNASLDPNTSALLHILETTGLSAGKIMQSVCDVPSRKAVYSLHNHTANEAVINKFDRHGSQTQSATRWTKTLGSVVGHQGLTAEFGGGDVKFWTSASYAITDSENHVVRFEVNDDPGDPENLLIENTEVFKVWPGNDGNGNTTPAVSSDGSLLVVELGLPGETVKIRVFKLQDLIDGGPGDYSTGYHIREFDTGDILTSNDHALQSLACDGQYIYALAGNADPATGKRFAKFTLDGELCGYTDDLQVGKSAALGDGIGDKFEPEDLQIVRHNGRDVLTMTVGSFDGTDHVNRVWLMDASGVAGVDSAAGGRVITLHDTNAQISPIVGFSFSWYNSDYGAHTLWGGGPDGGQGLYAGVTVYGKDHATYPQDIKIRSRNRRPLWFKAFTDVATYIAGVAAGVKQGLWSMEDHSLVDVDVFVSRALTADAPSTRCRIRDTEMVVGGVAAVNYAFYNRTADGWMQFGGGDNQAAGFTLRAYGSNTGEASTANGFIGYSGNTQVVRYRQDLAEWDFKTNRVKAEALTLTGLPTSSSGLSSGEVWNDGGVLKIA